MNNLELFAIAATVAVVVYVYCKSGNYGVNKHPTCSFKKLVLIRHGEKPSNGLGNLDCKGLNRSIALPDVLLRKFGKPDYIFAPNPARKVADHGILFNYIRPLVTIEPTAVRCNLPINSDYGYTDIEGLLREVCLPKYNNKVIFAAWEHKNLDMFAKLFAKTQINDITKIPDWPSTDFDSIFIFTKGATPSVTYSFSIDHEGLNGMSNTCPV